jgi:putative lantibiotic ABC transporter
MIPFVAILLFLLEFMIGHQVYQGHSYGSVNGWYVENGFFFLNYYFLLPFASMILVDLIRIEQVSKTISNFRLIPVNLKRLLQVKFMLALLINLLVSEFTFLAMLVLELMDGDFAFSNLAIVAWGLGYGIIAFAYTLSASVIVLFLGKYRKELLLALPLAFLLSFSGLFALTTVVGRYYLANLLLIIMEEFTVLTVSVYVIWMVTLVACLLYLLTDKRIVNIIFAYK